jgi:Protein of unknown function (DUF3040)
MLNHRDRHLLKGLERQLEKEDPTWVHQFKDLEPPGRARRNQRSEIAMGMLMLLAALYLVSGATVAAVIFGCAAIVVADIRYRR